MKSNQHGGKPPTSVATVVALANRLMARTVRQTMTVSHNRLEPAACNPQRQCSLAEALESMRCSVAMRATWCSIIQSHHVIAED